MPRQSNLVSNPNSIPSSLRPLLWGLNWESLDLQEDAADIILNVVNDETLAQWRWLIATYGKERIRLTLSTRLASEFHLESRRLAEVVFRSSFLHARSRSY